MKSTIKIWVVFIFALFVLLQSPVANAQTTSNIKIPKITKNLSYGLRNDLEVKTYQQFLKDSGYYQGPVTGNFLNLTLAASKSFQQAHADQILKPAGLSRATGYVGLFTRKFLDNAIGLDERGENPIIRYHTESGFSATPGEADLVINSAAQVGSPKVVVPIDYSGIGLYSTTTIRSYDFTVTFKNIGTAPVSASGFYLSMTGTVDDLAVNRYPQTLYINIPNGYVGPGESFSFPHVWVATYDHPSKVRFFINTGEQTSNYKGSRFPGIPESNYSNNTFETTVRD